MQGSGDRPAHQRIDTELGQAARLVDRQVVRQDLLFLRDDPPRLGFGDMDPTGGVEDRGDPMVPVREGRFHDRLSRFMLTRDLDARGVPRLGTVPDRRYLADNAIVDSSRELLKQAF